MPAPFAILGILLLSAGTLVIYTHFPSFSAAVNSAVSMGAEVRHVGAIGLWNPITSTLTAPLVSVLVQ